jgi:hypothetical protein
VTEAEGTKAEWRVFSITVGGLFDIDEVTIAAGENKKR